MMSYVRTKAMFGTPRKTPAEAKVKQLEWCDDSLPPNSALETLLSNSADDMHSYSIWHSSNKLFLLDDALPVNYQEIAALRVRPEERLNDDETLQKYLDNLKSFAQEHYEKRVMKLLDKVE